VCRGFRDPVTNPDVSIRAITDPADVAIAAFGRMQEAAYFAPETLISARSIPRLLETGSRRNFVLVAEHDGRVVGGALFHWLAEAGAGFSSFMGVDQAFRGQGVARRLHERRFAVLDAAAGRPIPGVFIDVVNPARLSDADLAREKIVGSDPWTRRRAFAHLGFRQVDIQYEQPVGGPNGGPVTILDLLYCARPPADTVATDLVVATMQDYWSAWLSQKAAYFAGILRARAHGQRELKLIWPEPPRAPQGLA
jgi:GNAT superfamily N-acetyltransferase